VIPYRQTGNNREYLIVFEQFSQCWSLPKGHMEPGENEAETALRELTEETGLTAWLDESSRTVVEYPISPIARKQVVFFWGEISGTAQIREGEIEKFQWVKSSQLEDFLHPDTVNTLKKQGLW
jgi:8-oxo-dGTP pyrophosphatase MutT (NUDIX family)